MTVTVAVTGLPGLLADVVRDTFADDAGVRVVLLETTEPGDVDAAIRRLGPDVVIVGVPDGDPLARRGLPYHLVLEHRDPVVLALAADGRSAWRYELRPQAQPIQEVTPAGLRTAVYDALGAGRGAAAVSTFSDRQMVRLRDPGQLADLVDPPGDAAHTRIRALLAAMYTMDFADVRGVSDVRVRRAEFQRPVFAPRRTAGTWFRTTPDYARTEVTLERFDPSAPIWVDVCAEFDLSLLLEIDGGEVESIVTREITGVTSLDDFRSRFRFLDLDAFLRQHGITTVEELRDAAHYLLTEIHLRAAGPFDANDPANLHHYELRLAILIRDTLDVTAALRDAKLARAAVENTVVTKDPQDAEIRTPYAPVLLLPAAVVPGPPLTQAALESFFAAEGVLALFV